MRSFITGIVTCCMLSCCISAEAAQLASDTVGCVADTLTAGNMCSIDREIFSEADSISDASMMNRAEVSNSRELKLDLYDYPYSRTRSMPDWKRLWVNTGVLMGGGVATMVILETLPQDATAWNKRESDKVPLFKRYVNHIKAGPVWDHDNAIFNFILHPYGGAAYYMSARSCGFNVWGSFLYSFCISTLFWEYGFEAFNEIPSVQDLVITPVVGSLFGEGFYLIKRHIVSNGYRLCESRILGFAVAFLVDPVNEVVGYFRGYQKKRFGNPGYRKERFVIDSSPWVRPAEGGMAYGMTVRCTF
ncbi:MAG: DUF3943 domain-containing protein [Muribaculaceae bacterium]|nr:DUF3943 domain-containing protein [Muribaculaceae bacterium]